MTSTPTLPLSQILAELGAANANGITLTPEQLKAYVSQASVAVEGDATLFYSGKMGNGISAGEIAKAIGEANENVITIAKTDAYALLGSDEFKEAFDKTYSGYSSEEVRGILNGTTDAAGQYQKGYWDIPSEGLAESAAGDVRTLSGFSDPDRIWAQTELPTLLENGNVTSIDGIPREDLVALRDSVIAKGGSTAEGLEAVRNAVAARSWLYSAENLTIASGLNGDLLVDTGNFFSDTQGISDIKISSDTLCADTLKNPMYDYMTAEKWADLARGQSYLEQMDYANRLSGVTKGLSKLGTAAAVLSFVLSAKDAQAAYAEGDTGRAKSIMADWATGFVGGLAGGIAAAEIVGGFLAPLYLTGPVGAVVATVLTIGAGIIGSIFGDEFAHYLVDEAGHLGEFLEGIGHWLGQHIPTPYDIKQIVNDLFTQSRSWARRDPLALDFDGDGIETVGAMGSTTVLFDHDGDGVKTGTGWIKRDDGLLDLNKNNNGDIDNGSELFGVEFVKSN
jgi:hypothetical protein